MLFNGIFLLETICNVTLDGIIGAFISYIATECLILHSFSMSETKPPLKFNSILKFNF